MKIEFNNRVYRIENTCSGCLEYSFTSYTCLGNIGRCFLHLNEIFVYDHYSQLFEL